MLVRRYREDRCWLGGTGRIESGQEVQGEQELVRKNRDMSWSGGADRLGAVEKVQEGCELFRRYTK